MILLLKFLKEKLSKTLSKYITMSDCFDNTLLVLSVISGSVSIASFATVFAVPVGIAFASRKLVLAISNGIAKYILKTIRNCFVRKK